MPFWDLVSALASHLNDLLKVFLFCVLDISSFSVPSSTPSHRGLQPHISPRPVGSAPTGGTFFPATATARVNRSNAFDSLHPTGKVAAPMVAMSGPDSVIVDKDKIRQVAEFCANKGVAKLKSLQDNPESKALMPFLFEGNPGYEEFMATLKSLVGLAANPPPSPLQAAAPPLGGSLYQQSRMLSQQPPPGNFPSASHNSNLPRRPNSRFN